MYLARMNINDLFQGNITGKSFSTISSWLFPCILSLAHSNTLKIFKLVKHWKDAKFWRLSLANSIEKYGVDGQMDCNENLVSIRSMSLVYVEQRYNDSRQGLWSKISQTNNKHSYQFVPFLVNQSSKVI